MAFDEPLSGEEAARRFRSDQDSIFFPIGQFILQFGLTEAEFRTEATSGRLVVRGSPAPNGFTNCAVTAGDALKWLAHPNTPRKFVDHFDRLGKERPRP